MPFPTFFHNHSKQFRSYDKPRISHILTDQSKKIIKHLALDEGNYLLGHLNHSDNLLLFAQVHSHLSSVLHGGYTDKLTGQSLPNYNSGSPFGMSTCARGGPRYLPKVI